MRKDSSPAAIKRKPLNQNLKPPTTQTPRQKAIAAGKARANTKKAEILKRFNSLTPAQKTAMKQTQQAKALAPKQRQGTNAKLGRRGPVGRSLAGTLLSGRFKKTPGAAIPKRSTATSGKRSRNYSLGRRRFT